MDLQRMMIVGPPDLTNCAPPLYANVAHVSYTPFDFRLTFSLLSAPKDGQQPGGLEAPTLMPQAVAELVLPAAAVPALVDVLRAELDQFTRRFGTPVPSSQQIGPRDRMGVST
jgi:Protein of unknown function (DUF3467)